MDNDEFQNIRLRQAKEINIEWAKQKLKERYYSLSADTCVFIEIIFLLFLISTSSYSLWKDCKWKLEIIF